MNISVIFDVSKRNLVGGVHKNGIPILNFFYYSWGLLRPTGFICIFFDLQLIYYYHLPSNLPTATPSECDCRAFQITHDVPYVSTSQIPFQVFDSGQEIFSVDFAKLFISVDFAKLFTSVDFANLMDIGN